MGEKNQQRNVRAKRSVRSHLRRAVEAVLERDHERVPSPRRLDRERAVRVADRDDGRAQRRAFAADAQEHDRRGGARGGGRRRVLRVLRRVRRRRVLLAISILLLAETPSPFSRPRAREPRVVQEVPLPPRPRLRGVVVVQPLREEPRRRRRARRRRVLLRRRDGVEGADATREVRSRVPRRRAEPRSQRVRPQRARGTREDAEEEEEEEEEERERARKRARRRATRTHRRRARSRV